MSITITQRCDGCDRQRELSVGFYGQPRTLEAAAQQGGWRKVRDDKHLCSECIAQVLA